jgi:hypothetical protein
MITTSNPTLNNVAMAVRSSEKIISLLSDVKASSIEESLLSHG